MILRYGGKYSNARQQCPDGAHKCLHDRASNEGPHEGS